MAEGDRRHDRSYIERPGSRSLPPHMGSRLPFFLPWVPKPAAGAADGLPSPPVLTESCGFKLIMGTVGGTPFASFRSLFNCSTSRRCVRMRFVSANTDAGASVAVIDYILRMECVLNSSASPSSMYKVGCFFYCHIPSAPAAGRCNYGCGLPCGWCSRDRRGNGVRVRNFPRGDGRHAAVTDGERTRGSPSTAQRTGNLML